ncbi:MAG: asparagine synthase (glutamine-hydrolyzing) [Flavobacteriales bacterium]
MCSISGYIVFDPSTLDWKETESLMRSALQQSTHRGPDHQGLLQVDCGFLGHNRLSITDLSALGNQPMSDASGKFHLVLNGEIFNHKALRADLEKRGVEFRSHSDTEVLLQMLICFGKEALNQLEGFFSFAFFDVEKGNWLFARDRFGEKPFYYSTDSGSFRFASELRSLIRLGIDKAIDTCSLSMLLQFSYIPAPSTIFRGVFKLEPGHCIEIEKSAKTILLTRWYKPETKVWRDPESEVIPRFRILLTAAVERRLESDVPLGCFLSGGMDSSVIALLASRANSKLKTYSIGFPDRSFMDETKYAKEVAAHLGTHHEVFELSSSSFGNEIEAVLNDLDEPFGDASALAMWLLARETKKHISVALSGDGADELLGGYNKHEALLRSMEETNLNHVLPSLALLLDIFPSGRNGRFSNKIRQIKRYASGLEKNLKSRYIYWSSFSDGSDSEDVLHELNVADKGARINHFIQDIRKDNFNSILLADQQLVLQGDMLAKVDMMSMAHALEVRAPFLDHQVVEFINSLPPTKKITRSNRKILLRESFGDALPESVFTRAKKGFEVPLEDLLRGPMKAMIQDLLSTDRLQKQKIFRPDVVQDILREFYLLRRSSPAAFIYSMYVFQHWYYKHVEN